MPTCVDLLDALKARYDLRSDYAAAPVIGVTRSSVSRIRNKIDYFSDSTAIKVAELLGIDPAIAVAVAHSDRAKCDSEKTVWHDILNRLGGLAA